MESFLINICPIFLFLLGFSLTSQITKFYKLQVYYTSAFIDSILTSRIMATEEEQLRYDFEGKKKKKKTVFIIDMYSTSGI